MGKRNRIMLIVLLLSVTQFSCIKETDEMGSEDDRHNSEKTGTSHNPGKDCVSCHRFSVGGSVYQKDLTTTYPGTIVKLTTQANGAGTVVAKITTDKSGNIYTLNSVKFGSGLYVSVIGSYTKYMTSAIIGGSCNSCHGSSTYKVWAE